MMSLNTLSGLAPRSRAASTTLRSNRPSENVMGPTMNTA